VPTYRNAVGAEPALAGKAVLVHQSLLPVTAPCQGVDVAYEELRGKRENEGRTINSLNIESGKTIEKDTTLFFYDDECTSSPCCTSFTVRKWRFIPSNTVTQLGSQL